MACDAWAAGAAWCASDAGVCTICAGACAGAWTPWTPADRILVPGCLARSQSINSGRREEVRFTTIYPVIAQQSSQGTHHKDPVAVEAASGFHAVLTFFYITGPFH